MAQVHLNQEVKCKNYVPIDTLLGLMHKIRGATFEKYDKLSPISHTIKLQKQYLLHLSWRNAFTEFHFGNLIRWNVKTSFPLIFCRHEWGSLLLGDKIKRKGDKKQSHHLIFGYLQACNLSQASKASVKLFLLLTLHSLNILAIMAPHPWPNLGQP